MLTFPDHVQPAFCSTQQNGQGRVCFSSQRVEGPTFCHPQKFVDLKPSDRRMSHRSINTSVKFSGQQLQPEPEEHDSASIWRTISSSLDAFYRFSRPHTVIGTVKSCHMLFHFDEFSAVKDLLMKLCLH
jgi:homogentisate phytyltransferase / homogentisate geranylgeranyltransferase